LLVEFKMHKNKYSEIIKQGNIDLQKNHEMSNKMSLSVFIKYVKTGGQWDYKNQDSIKQGVSDGLYSSDLLQEFGNYHFGIVANGFGFGLEHSMAGAGAY